MNKFRIGYILIIIFRLTLLPVFIFNPLIGWIISVSVDVFDYGVALRSGIIYNQYQTIDKFLDIVGRFYLVFSAWYFNWEVLSLVVILFLLRLIGDLLFFFIRNEKLLFYFPNILEFFFPIYIIFRFTIYQAPLSVSLLLVLIIVSAVTKISHEYFLHIYGWIDSDCLKYIKNHPEHERQIPRRYQTKESIYGNV